MPPKASNPPKRKGPAFKPPRPVKDSTQATTATKRASTAARPAGVSKKAAASRRKESPTLVSSSEGEDGHEFSDSDLDDEMADVPLNEPRSAVAPVQSTLEPIPQKLLGRLLQEGFEDEDTKIHRGAMELTSKYMEIFVREAISRAAFERSDANKQGRGSGISDGFLQVDDLEKLTPQLVLDF